MILTVLFCEVLPGAPRPLLRIGTPQPAAHRGDAHVCFFYRLLAESCVFCRFYSLF